MTAPGLLCLAALALAILLARRDRARHAGRCAVCGRMIDAPDGYLCDACWEDSQI